MASLIYVNKYEVPDKSIQVEFPQNLTFSEMSQATEIAIDPLCWSKYSQVVGRENDPDASLVNFSLGPGSNE